MKSILKSFIVVLGLAQLSQAARHDIRDYGAVAEDDSLEVEQANAVAFMKAIVAAN